MSLRVDSSQKIMGRYGSLTHSGATEISISGSNPRVQWVRNIPLEPVRSEAQVSLLLTMKKNKKKYQPKATSNTLP